MDLELEFQKKRQQFEKALNTLFEVLEESNEKYEEIIRDSTIQRFEYTVEIFWKMLKKYLKWKSDIESPYAIQTFRHCRVIGLFSDEETEFSIKMVQDRNFTSHAYIEEVAEKIYQKIPKYAEFMRAISKKLNQDR